MNSAGWRWKILPSYRRKQELNSFIAGGMKELLSLSVKQGGESSLAMSLFPCLAMAQRRAWWLFQRCLLIVPFSLFPFFSAGIIEIYSTWNLPCETNWKWKIWIIWRIYFYFHIPHSALFAASFANLIRHPVTMCIFTPLFCSEHLSWLALSAHLYRRDSAQGLFLLKGVFLLWGWDHP